MHDAELPATGRGLDGVPGGKAVRPPVASRRAFLRGFAGLAGAGAVTSLAGCDLFGGGSPPDPEPHALAGFLAATVALGGLYDATLKAVDALPAAVGAIRDAHREHAKAIAEAIGEPTPQPAASASAAPTDRTAAIAALIAAEKTAGADAISECLAASPRFAALLGSIAAARATHLEVLK